MERLCTLESEEDSCEDGDPWAIPYFLGGKWVSSVVLEHLRVIASKG